jgi:hypothetical protein
MATRLHLNIDRDSPALARVASLTSPAIASPPEVVRADILDLELVFCRPTTRPGLAFEPVDVTSDDIRVAIGRLNDLPDGGTFTLTDPNEDETTAAISATATAAQIQSAVRLLTTYPDATVTELGSGIFEINRITPGVVAPLTADATALDPAGSTISLATTQVGTASVPQRQVLILRKAAAAGRFTGWSTLPAAAATVTQVQTGASGVNSIQRIVWSRDAYAGTVSLTLDVGDSEETIRVAHNVTATDLATAIATHSEIAATDISVRASGQGEFLIEFIGTLGGQDITAITADATDLEVPVGIRGSINTNTPGMTALVGSESSASALFEVERLVGGNDAATVYQVPVNIIADLIPNTPASSGPLPTYVTTTDLDTLVTESIEGATRTYISGGGGPTVLNESRTSTTTLAAVPGLSIPLAVGEYAISFLFVLQVVGAGGFKWQPAFSGTAVVSGHEARGMLERSQQGSTPAFALNNTWNTVTTYAAGNNRVIQRDLNLKVTAAGNLTFLWAQNVSDVAATRLDNPITIHVRRAQPGT